MEKNNLEDTLKKMGVVLEKVVQKVDELEKRVVNLEQKTLAQKGKELKESEKQQLQANTPSLKDTGSGFGTGFLSSLLGSFAGMSLFSLLFNNSVSAHQLAESTGISDDEFFEIDKKLEEIDQKLEEIDEKIENIDNVDIAEIEDDTLKQDFGYEDFSFGDDFDIDV